MREQCVDHTLLQDERGSQLNDAIARISVHLFPPNSQVEGSTLSRADCRAKGRAPGFKMAIVGAAGGIGQPLAMLMKMNPLVSVLHLYDVVNAPGVTADISHMDTGYCGMNSSSNLLFSLFLDKNVITIYKIPQLESALMSIDLVIIPAGVPRKPGMTRDDLFNINAGIVRTICEGIAKVCPKAIVNLISNPVNSTVPIAAEVFKKGGTCDPKRLLGVTMLDVVRANTFVAEVLGLDPREVDVPVVGGHAEVDVPVVRGFFLSYLQNKWAAAQACKIQKTVCLCMQVKPPCSFTKEETEYLTNWIQNGRTEVVEAKAGAGSTTLSMAYTAVKFAYACLCGLRRDAGVVECTFVASEVTELPFFATKVRLGRSGAEEIYQLGPLNERIGLEKAKTELTSNIQKGVSFIKK
ncbi:hypothetical protein ACFX2C_003460 [Malus domestica]